MFLPIKPVTDRRPRKDGTVAIYIQYCHSSERRTLLSTDLSLPPRYWNKLLLHISPELPPEFGQAEQLNAQLQKMIRAAEDLVNAALKEKAFDPIPILKRPGIHLLARPIKRKKRLLLQNLLTTSRGSTWISFISRTYKVMKNRLMAFQRFQRQKIEFSSLDFNFYESFVNYLTYDHTHMRRNISIRGLKRNSIGTSIKQLRIFVRDRSGVKLSPPSI